MRDILSCGIYRRHPNITGKNNEEHLATLEKVIDCLETAGLCLQRKKCHYMMSSVEYLGHRIDVHGLHPTEEKLRAIKDAPEPKSVGELKAFLGMLYYSSFIPSMATSLASLYQLLKQNARWKWSKQHLGRQRTFCYRRKSLCTMTQTRKLAWHVMHQKAGLEQYCRTDNWTAQTNLPDSYHEHLLTLKNGIYNWKKKAWHVYSESLGFMLTSMVGASPSLLTISPCKDKIV